jgi:hypothetical protein
MLQTLNLRNLCPNFSPISPPSPSIASLTQLLTHTSLFSRFTPHPNPSRSSLLVPPTPRSLPQPLPTPAVPALHLDRSLLLARSAWALALGAYSLLL